MVRKQKRREGVIVLQFWKLDLVLKWPLGAKTSESCLLVLKCPPVWHNMLNYLLWCQKCAFFCLCPSKSLCTPLGQRSWKKGCYALWDKHQGQGGQRKGWGEIQLNGADRNVSTVFIFLYLCVSDNLRAHSKKLCSVSFVCLSGLREIIWKQTLPFTSYM